MSEPAKSGATYDDLFNIPENTVGQIIDGELIVTPRPSRKHARTSSIVGAKFIPPYDLGEGGGPGGWIILFEPEIGLGENILVPDLAGWRKERFPIEEETNWISVCPDWVCEVLSPNTIRIDKIKKMTIYARHGVGYFWLIDPTQKTLEVLGLESGKWVIIGVYVEDDKVRAEPFDAVEIDLGSLWLEATPPPETAPPV